MSVFKWLLLIFWWESRSNEWLVDHRRFSINIPDYPWKNHCNEIFCSHELIYCLLSTVLFPCTSSSVTKMFPWLRILTNAKRVRMVSSSTLSTPRATLTSPPRWLLPCVSLMELWWWWTVSQVKHLENLRVYRWKSCLIYCLQFLLPAIDLSHLLYKYSDFIQFSCYKMHFVDATQMSSLPNSLLCESFISLLDCFPPC